MNLDWLDKIIEEQKQPPYAHLLPDAIKAEEQFSLDELEEYAREQGK